MQDMRRQFLGRIAKDSQTKSYSRIGTDSKDPIGSTWFSFDTICLNINKLLPIINLFICIIALLKIEKEGRRGGER